MIRILIADDQALVRAGFKMILDSEDDLDVIGEATDGAQAVELARRLAPAKLSTGLLLRVRDTPPQAFLDRRQRLGNMAHAFAMDPMRAARVAGRRVVLVDDVMTSGATLEAAARALRRAGAARVDGLVLARTDLD